MKTASSENISLIHRFQVVGFERCKGLDTPVVHTIYVKTAPQGKCSNLKQRSISLSTYMGCGESIVSVRVVSYFSEFKGNGDTW